MLVHSSLSGIIENGKANTTLLNFLNRGIARRSVICYPPENLNQDKEPYNLEKEKKAAKNKNKFIMQLEIVFQSFLFHGTDNDHIFQELKIDDEVMEYFIKYKNICHCDSLKIDREKYEGLRAEVSGRPWKTLKIAGVLAVISHHQDLKIKKDDLLMAIYITSIYGNHVKSFYEIDKNNDAERLFKYILDNPNCMKTDIRDVSFAEKDK